MRTTAKLSEIVNDWITSLDVQPQTRKDYRRKIASWFKWLVARKINPREPARVNVLDYKQHLTTEGYSIYTINSQICIVKLFYTWAEDRRLYDNIAAGIRSIKTFGDYAKMPLSMQQSTNLIASLDGDTTILRRDKLIVGLMIFNGLRTCEVERINIEDLDIMDGQHILRIQRKGRLDKSEIVVLHTKLIDWLSDYLADRDPSPEDPLFVSHHPSRESQRLTRQSISHMVKTRLRAVGINDNKITAHSLRHTFGVMLVEGGCDIETVRDMMGHCSTSTTRIYVDIAQKRKLLHASPGMAMADRILKNLK